MLKTTAEIMAELGASVRARRLGQNWSQEEAAKRAGISLRTWIRLEASGHANIENLVNAAIALRCENGFAELFPAPSARSMDELLERQRQSPTKLRARTRKRS